MNDKKDEKIIIKVCPILSLSHVYYKDNLGMVHCIKGECAFYNDDDDKGCAILVFSQNISKMWNYGLQIMRK